MDIDRADNSAMAIVNWAIVKPCHRIKRVLCLYSNEGVSLLMVSTQYL